MKKKYVSFAGADAVVAIGSDVMGEVNNFKYKADALGNGTMEIGLDIFTEDPTRRMENKTMLVAYSKNGFNSYQEFELDSLILKERSVDIAKNNKNEMVAIFGCKETVPMMAVPEEVLGIDTGDKPGLIFKLISYRNKKK